jgi:hypothetical protein
LTLASPSDTEHRGVNALRVKMNRYQANGARVGWLPLPAERAKEIWRGAKLINRIIETHPSHWLA